MDKVELWLLSTALFLFAIYLKVLKIYINSLHSFKVMLWHSALLLIGRIMVLTHCTFSCCNKEKEHMSSLYSF